LVAVVCAAYGAIHGRTRSQPAPLSATDAPLIEPELVMEPAPPPPPPIPEIAIQVARSAAPATPVRKKTVAAVRRGPPRRVIKRLPR
jgi:hypothetical protein